jgi:signal transduction histidine kinase
MNVAFGPAVVAGLAGFTISALAAGAIGLFSAWLARDVDALSKAATALAEYKDYSHLEFRISEFEKVAEGLTRAAAALKAEEAFRKRVVDELAHRLRNKLATIQAIIRYRLRGHPKLRDEIFSRLTALSATDDLIISAQGRGAEL